MYTGNNKLGRGGSRGGASAKRNVFGGPPPQRLSSSSTSGRLSLGGSRNQPPSSAPLPAPATSTEDTFRLVGGDPLSFAALIRLAPDLVDEIKRVEAQGGAAKIKFDSNPNNPLGNVIDVGGKEFRFTWSRETGGLCDIYEERQRAEGGNGLLVESGCAWRKLNVQRVLDESAKNHVKRLSEEAERQQKSRKAKFLDPSNAATKSQMRALAAAEASPWKHKKDFFKKRSFEPPQVGGPAKSVHKSGFPAPGAARGRLSASPVPSPQKQSISSASPSMRRQITESQATREDTVHIQAKAKENAVSAEKDLTSRLSDRIQGAATRREHQVEGAKDVQNLLVTLLKENPKGMSIKTLEKAVADNTSHSTHKIEPLLQKIANFEPPGMYILKPGLESDNQLHLSSDSGSSPEGNRQKQYVPEDELGPAPASNFPVKSHHEDLEEQVPMNELNSVNKIDPSQHFSALFGDDEIPDKFEGQATSSRDSGSDSDSDSSDSGSDSGSRSRSRSPVGTASGSGSDSDNDSSSKSKEASDVEIDILNDDDNEPKKLLDAEHGLSSATAPWSMHQTGPPQDGIFGDQDGYPSEDIDIENDCLGDNEAVLGSVSQAHAMSTEKLKSLSPDHGQGKLYGTDVLNDAEDIGEFKHEHPNSLMKSKGTSKRGSDEFQFEENAENFKRLKAGSTAQSFSGYIGGSSPRSSPDITIEDHEDNNNLQMPDSFDRNDDSNLAMQRGYNNAVHGKHAPQSGRRRSHDNIEIADKFGKNARNRGSDGNHQESSTYKREGFSKPQDGEFGLNDKVNGKFKESGFDKKQDARMEAHYEKQSEEGKKSHALGTASRQQLGPSPKDGGQVDSVDRRRLQRELSDLELGELREPLSDEPEVTKKKIKHSDTKSSTSGSVNADLRGRSAGKSTLDIGIPSLPISRAGGPKSSDNWSKKRSPEPFADVNGQPSHRTVQSQQQLSKVARADVASLNKASDANRLRFSEGAVNQGTDVEGYGESQKKSNVSTQLEESKQEHGSRKANGSKSLKSNALTDSSDRRKDASSVEGRNDSRKKNASLDDDVSYSKYEKEEPELKGPINNFSQYKEYVQEYCGKYESYRSLSRILESFRDEFQKMGNDLESAKGRDMERYYTILTQLRESYNQCGTRHKRLKKIFTVLHEELKHLKQRIKDFAEENMRD